MPAPFDHLVDIFDSFLRFFSPPSSSSTFHFTLDGPLHFSWTFWRFYPSFQPLLAIIQTFFSIFTGFFSHTSTFPAFHFTLDSFFLGEPSLFMDIVKVLSNLLPPFGYLMDVFDRFLRFSSLPSTFSAFHFTLDGTLHFSWTSWRF